jgi:hypothetical protein
LSVQHWDTSHPNVPIRKVTKQSSLEGKEDYLREDAFLITKKAAILLTIQKKRRSKPTKIGWSGLANRIVQFWQKISEPLDSATKASKWYLKGT